jgi:glycosyltransferase involved in cell wall biosynthesis
MTQSNKTKTTGLLETVTHQTGWKLPRLFPSPFDAPRPPVAIDGLAPSDRYLRQPFNPRISVVVPNYNHAPFLAQRLNSIYRQSYEPFEVILLDDCSTDDSLSVLNAYKAKFPRITRILANSSNTGSPFRQWKRGLEEAQGDLVWIAESDDFCDRDFLARLVPFFNDEAVNLAYAKTTFVDVKGKPLSSSFDDYVRDISPTKWAHDYVETAHNEVKQAMGLKNTIPNVSGVLFRKPPVLDVVKNDVWLNMKICGDWVFYLHVIRGGKIGYCQQTNNYYRYHPANTSSAAKHRQPSYYKEHAVVARQLKMPFKPITNYFGVTGLPRSRTTSGLHGRSTRYTT